MLETLVHRFIQSLCLALYSLLMTLAVPLARRKWQRRAVQEPLYGQYLPERMGYYSGPAESAASGEQAGPLVWLHTVSLGETRAVTPFLAALRQALPGMRLLLTHGTATGREAGKALLLPGDVQVWQPWDSPAAVRRFVAHFRPAIGLLMETEVWPNLVHACRAAGVPLCLVNARMSDKTLRQSLRLACLSKPAYAALHAVWAQTEADAQRLRQLDAPVQGVMGNFKYEVLPSTALIEQGRAWRQRLGGEAARPVVMFAVSREGEEAMWVQAMQGIQHPVQWLIVPRHPQRFDEVAQLLQSAGYTVLRRSQWGSPLVAATEQASAPQSSVVWLGDSVGEMPLYYGMADVALLGGSFAPLGGQNLIEAAACGVPVVMGPHTFNFAQACSDAESIAAARRATDLADAIRIAHEWSASPAALSAAQQQCQHWISQHRGAAQRTVEAVVGELGEMGIAVHG